MSNEEYAKYEGMAVNSLAEEEARAYGAELVVAQRRAALAFEHLVPNRELSVSRQTIYVLEVDGTDVGVLWYEMRDANREAYIYDIVIWPPHRKKGLGRRALAQLEERLRPLGVRRLILNVFKHNQAALSLYSALGYEARSCLLMKTI